MPALTRAQISQRNREKEKEKQMICETELAKLQVGFKHIRTELVKLYRVAGWPALKRDEEGDIIVNVDAATAFAKEEAQIIIQTINTTLAVMDKLIPEEDPAEKELLKDLLGKIHPDNKRQLQLAESKLKKNPRDLDAWVEKGIAKMRLDNFTDAMEAFERAINLARAAKNEEVLPEIYFNLAGACSCVGNKTRALEKLKMAIDLDPDYRDKAKTDQFLENVHDLPDFKVLTKKTRTKKTQSGSKPPSKLSKFASESNEGETDNDVVGTLDNLEKQVQEPAVNNVESDKVPTKGNLGSELKKVRTLEQYLDFIDKLTKMAQEQEESLEDFINKKLPGVKYQTEKSYRGYLEFIEQVSKQEQEEEQSPEKEKPAKKSAKKMAKKVEKNSLAINEEHILEADSALDKVGSSLEAGIEILRKFGGTDKQVQKSEQSTQNPDKIQKTYSDVAFSNYFFDEFVPEEYKETTFRIKLESIKLEEFDSTEKIMMWTVPQKGGDSFRVAIDLKSFRIIHTCEFFTNKVRNEHKFCPHIGAVFRKWHKMKPDIALEWFRFLAENKEQWTFEETAINDALDEIDKIEKQSQEEKHSLEKTLDTVSLGKENHSGKPMVEEFSQINEKSVLLALDPKLKDIQGVITKMGISDKADVDNVKNILQTLVTSKRVMVELKKDKIFYRIKSFDENFQEILPEEYKNKIFLIKPLDIDLKTVEPESEQVIAWIPGGTVVIDGRSLKLKHYCEMFTSLHQNARKICPHIGAVFQKLQKIAPRLAFDLLRSMVGEKEKWNFEGRADTVYI